MPTTNSDLKLFVFDSANYASEAAAYAAACAKELIFACRVDSCYQFGFSPISEKYNTTPKVYYFPVTDLINESPDSLDESDYAEIVTVTYNDFQAWLDWVTGVPQLATAPNESM